MATVWGSYCSINQQISLLIANLAYSSLQSGGDASQPETKKRVLIAMARRMAAVLTWGHKRSAQQGSASAEADVSPRYTSSEGGSPRTAPLAGTESHV